MKERPILFSGPMVRAILDGRKTMTRRVVKGAGASNVTRMLKPWISDSVYRTREMCGHDAGPYFDCPYGETGDRLWVREEHYAFGHWERNGFTKKGNPKWRFVNDGKFILFDVQTLGFLKSRSKSDPHCPHWYKRLGRFMPKKYARTFLEITGIRVERLQDISDHDAIAEGIDNIAPNEWRDYLDGGIRMFPTGSFETLWVKINGRESWEANPWVWVVEFKRIEEVG